MDKIQQIISFLDPQTIIIIILVIIIVIFIYYNKQQPQIPKTSPQQQPTADNLLNQLEQSGAVKQDIDQDSNILQ